MKSLSARLLTTALVLLAATACHARADWTYTSTPSVPGLSVGTTGSGTASVTLTDTSGASGTSIPIIAYVITPANTAMTFDPTKETYTLALKITDTTQNNSGTLNFNGSLGGTLTPSGTGLTNTLTVNPANSTLTLDGHVYTVTIPPQTLVENQAGSGQPNILANVSVSNVTGGNTGGNPGGNTSGTPEPTSLVLGGLGFSFLGIRGWWKKRPHRSTQPAV